MKILIYTMGILLFLGCDSAPESPLVSSPSECTMPGNECVDGFLCMMNQMGGYSCVSSSNSGGATDPSGGEPPLGGQRPAGTEPPTGTEPPAGSEPPAG